VGKERLLAFSDGVIAIIITIMVLELKAPHGSDMASLLALAPVFLSYVLSFAYVAIYWHNHHHLMSVPFRVNGAVMWANSHLLFWLSLIPFATAWMDDNHFAALPTAVYGVSLLMPALAFLILQAALVRSESDERHLRSALGRNWKGIASPIGYLVGIGLAYVDARLALAMFILIAVLWFIPDRRIERRLRNEPS
jgi:uncharacterized membrane protein